MAAPAPSRDSITETPSGTLPSRSQRRAFVPVHPTACGKYTIIAKVGHGGMAEVFLAVSSGMGGFRKLAVVKRIHPQLLEEPEFVEMFLDEARLAARLSHPNVVLTHEVGEHDGVPFIAMEYMEGQAYDKLLKAMKRAGRQIPIKTAVRIAMESLSGLHYAHQLKDYDGKPLSVVHRDISPSNIFVTYQGVVKILDFGIAKANTKLSETRTGQIKGKLSYMAPEQARGGEMDQRADIWSVGVTVFETCTSRRLFKGESDVDTLQRVLTADVHTLLTDGENDLPEPLLRVVTKALARRKEDRYSDGLEMRKALDDILPELEGPDPDIETFISELFEDIAADQRKTMGELLENAEKLTAPPLASAGLLETDLPAGTETKLEKPDTERRRRSPLLVLAFLALGLLGAAVIGLLLERQPDPEGRLAANDSAAANRRLPRAAIGDESPGAGGAPADIAAPATGQAGSLEAQQPDEDADEGNGAGTVDDDAPEDNGEDQNVEVAAVARRPRRPRPRRPRPASTETSAPTVVPAAPAANGEGTLLLQTTPWSEVFLGSRSLGTTPLRNVRLPVGRHVLRLRNTEADIDTRYPVTIRREQTTRVNIGL